MNGSAINMMGLRFGRLTIIARGKNNSNQTARWVCRCECGKEKEISRRNLINGTSSCGCLNREVCAQNRTTHGRSGTPLHGVWATMRRRCSDPNHQDAHNYCKRGIKVCREWDSDFNTFYIWAMKAGYVAGLTIDRKNNNGDYSPENCRFVPRKVQANNMRANRKIEHNGVTKTMAEWADFSGIPYFTLRARLDTGWPIEIALWTPVRSRPHHV